MQFPLFVGVLCLSLFCYALLYVQSSFAIILKRKRKLVALLLLSCRCLVTVNFLWLFLAVPCAGMRCVIVIFLDHTHLLFFMVMIWRNSLRRMVMMRMGRMRIIIMTMMRRMRRCWKMRRMLIIRSQRIMVQ